MQPTENKQPAKDELITHIRESLKTHEESYKLGAWEKFNEKSETKRTPIFWISRLGGVAAVFALCFILFLLTKNDPQQLEDKIVKTNSSKVLEEQPTAGSETLNNSANEVIEKSNALQEKINIVASNDSKGNLKNNEEVTTDNNNLASTNNHITAANSQVAIIADAGNQISQNTVIDKQIDQQIAIVTQEKGKPTIEEFLASETRKNDQSNKKFMKSIKSKWALGLMVAPSFGNSEELNMGYGVSLGYNFSDKLSFVTGISYNEMTASKNLPTTVGMSSILLGNNKSLAEISQKVTGLDIPLELKYNFNKSIYANAGISAFAVLGQSRNNTFIQEIVVKGAVDNATATTGGINGAAGSSDASASKGQFANSYIVNQKTVERAALEDQNSVNYLGFYNFSVGFKRRVLKKHSIAIEPFIKLPIKQVTQDNLNLLGTGLRLKVDL